MPFMREYIITAGHSDNFYIVARVEGSPKPALSTLYRKFLTEMGYVALDKRMNRFDFIEKNITNSFVVVKAAAEAGYVVLSIPECFVSYLVKACGFERLPDNEFYVSY